jgi:class 3 adenylate cyclase/predicted ATPase
MWSAAMDVGEWLRGLGLGQYETVFREHTIDMDVLADLKDGELAQIGVSLGDRKRLLKAIASLCKIEPSSSSREKAPPAEANLPSTPTPVPLAAGSDAERRPLTVMFCDLVDSTTLASRLDAEDWRSLVNAYLDEASAAVTGLGGHVLKKLGDGLMALFGYPQAQENDTERAVRAALAIHRSLGELNSRNAASAIPELVARIGLETGPVVVDATGEVFGEAPNIAARVQAAAEPGTVLVTSTVQRQVAGLFVVEDRGAHELKGAPAPVTLYRILRVSGGRRRKGPRLLTPFVGRAEDLGVVDRRWERARAGEGQFVLIVGEPGIGKSRLVEEFRARLGETRHSWIEWSSSQLLQNTPLHPVLEWGRARFCGPDIPPERRLAELESVLTQVKLGKEQAALLAPLIDIPVPSERLPSLSPEEVRRRQLAAMVEWAIAGARIQPVDLVFEDLQWFDPTSIDLVHALSDRSALAPLLILATSRPEFRPPWSLRPHHSVISLTPIGEVHVQRMVAEVASQRALSPEVIKGISERAGGVPLFVEEVTRLLLERGEADGLQAIPPTLQQSLTARLDRLGEAREVAQIGAVLRRDFTYALLRAVGGVDDPALQSALDRLADADLFIAEDRGPQANYRFKHALIQDAAYDSLLKGRRQVLHRRAAEVLRDDPERAAAEPEVIAHHFTEAGLDDLAIEWWGKAGDQALRRSAFQEAIAHLGKAIAMADSAGGGQAVDVSGQQLHMRVAYGNALIATRGYGAPETTEAFARARESAIGDKGASERLAADYGLWVGSYVRGELSAMRAYAEAFLGDVEAKPDSPEAGVAHRAAGLTHWFAGEYREARGHLERAVALFEPGRDDDLAFRFGQDAGVTAMHYLALTLWPLGDIERAISLGRDAEARIAGLAHVHTRVFGEHLAAMFELMRGNCSRAAPHAVEAARLAREHDLSLWRAVGVFLDGLARAAGPLGRGVVDMRRGIQLQRDQNALTFDGLHKIALAEAEACAGDVDRAIAVIEEAVATCERTEYRAFEAELHRVRGEMLLLRDTSDPAPAEEALRSAIGVAKQQGTRSFELRAALALAKLYQATGRPADAHAVLAPALEGFSPSLEMPEIAEAQALLAALAETKEVKLEVALRQRWQHLHVAYGNALIAARGYAAPETIEAFTKAREFAAGDTDTHARLAADHGLWGGSVVLGELAAMKAHAAAFLRDVAARPDSPEAGVAHRIVGSTHWYAGEYHEARSHLEQALALFKPGRDDDLALRFGHDLGVAAMLYLGLVLWPLGDVERAVSHVRSAEARIASLSYIGARAFGAMFAAIFELMRGDLARAAPNAVELARLAREHDLPHWRAYGFFLEGLASAQNGGLEGMRRGIELLRDQNALMLDGLIKIALADAEARANDVDRAVAILDDALAMSDRTGQRAFDAELHRVRGEMLLKRDPTNEALAEEAFKAAIAVARQQGTRSFELRAALALAKLYQATGRAADAHDVLAPALEGFPPSLEMPEIAEAMLLSARLA